MKLPSYDRFFKNLANPKRYAIIKSLEDKPKSVTEISEDIGEEQSSVSHHLKQLRQCKLIKATQKGKKRIYRLEETVKPALEAAKKHRKKHCPENCPYHE